MSIATLELAEKVTVTLPSDLKQKLLLMKDELSMSMSAIYKEALEAYIATKEKEKWERGVLLAKEDQVYQGFISSISGDTGDLYDY